MIYLIILSIMAASFIAAIIINIIKFKKPKKASSKITIVLSLVVIVLTAILALFLVLKEIKVAEFNFLAQIYTVYTYTLINLINGVIIACAILCLIVSVFRPKHKITNIKSNSDNSTDFSEGGIDEVIDNSSPINDIFIDLGTDERSIDTYIEGVTENLRQKDSIISEAEDYVSLINNIDSTFESSSKKKTVKSKK